MEKLMLKSKEGVGKVSIIYDSIAYTIDETPQEFSQTLIDFLLPRNKNIELVKEEIKEEVKEEVKENISETDKPKEEKHKSKKIKNIVTTDISNDNK